RGVFDGLSLALESRDLLWSDEGPAGFGEFQRTDGRGGAPGLSLDTPAVQSGERAHAPDGPGPGGAKRPGPTSQAGQSCGSLPCAKISVVGVVVQRHSGGGGPGKIAAPLFGISRRQTTGAESSEAKVIAGPFVSFS